MCITIYSWARQYNLIIGQLKMNITINFKSGKSLNMYAVDYAAAKGIKFSKKYKGLINSVVDRLGNKI